MDYQLKSFAVSACRSEQAKNNYDLIDWGKCPTCKRKKDDPEAVICSNAYHLPKPE